MMKARSALTLTLVVGLLGSACHGGARGPAPEPAAPATARAAGAAAPRSPADRAPPPASAEPSLYQRLGGMDAIRAVVDAFVARVGADERVNMMFRGVDLDNFKRLLAEQICQASGGPCTYSGRPMREAHQGLNITEEQWNAVVADLAGALDQFSVPQREKSELLAALAPLKAQIVGQ